ncbi:Chromatin modification-related protein Eaf7/MRGBP [Forsythia ovata]|uniref:Chromatin modification-related protein Eaf7/MRGBP n=1 Tax=Forsythia ovata TaxID=205694 RepID=A0ABD1XBU1_9LAMI
MRQNGKAKKEEQEEEEGQEEEEQEQEQDGVSVHSPCKIPNSSFRKEKSELELELRLLEALEIYPPAKLRGIHRHFVLYGLTEYLRRSFNQPFSGDDVLKLLDRFYNLEMVKPDDEDTEILNQEEDFRLPQSYFVTEDS